jgi:hypothetical protein
MISLKLLLRLVLDTEGLLELEPEGRPPGVLPQTFGGIVDIGDAVARRDAPLPFGGSGTGEGREQQTADKDRCSSRQ